MVMHLYAELLLNIRNVTVSVTLANQTSARTSARLSDDRCRVSVEHDGQAASIQLPARISSRVPLEQAVPQHVSNQLTFRLPLESIEPDLSRGFLDDADSVTPWSANDLREFECMHCAACRRDIVSPQKLTAWKDLPSENWAEMMEFWHCHKPHVKGQPDNSSAKGYSASNRLAAKPGVGLVDTSTFVLSPEDCSSLKVEKENEIDHKRRTLVCEGCGNFIGAAEDLISGFRIVKSQVALGFSNSVQLHLYPLQLWISALLLVAGEFQASKKILVRESKDACPCILIWIFTPDLWISSAETSKETRDTHCTGPNRAMKILWKQIRTASNGADNQENSLESIELAPQQFQCLENSLRANQKRLPDSARRYQDWDVGFLYRFSHGPASRATE